MWWCLGVVGLALVGWAALSTWRVLYPDRRPIPPPSPLPPDDVHTLTGPDGAVFDVWRLEASSPKARLLLCHGYYANRCTLGLCESRDALAILHWARRRDAQRPLPVGVDSIYSRLFPVLRRSIWRHDRLPTVPLAWITWWSLHLVLRRRLSAIDPVALAPRLHQPLFARHPQAYGHRVADFFDRVFA